MERKSIRVSFIFFNDDIFDSVKNKLENEFELIIDNENPEYLLCGEKLHYSYDKILVLGDVIKKYKNAITIFYTPESIMGDFNLFDYVIARDNISFGDRYMRHFYLKPEDNIYHELYRRKSYDEAKDILNQKKYFCNFIYSNIYANPKRDEIFYKLSEYKFVHSLGKHLKNSDIKIEDRDGDWFDSSINAKKDFKFSISAENTWYKDGITEKIFTSIFAKTIPIYFGDYNIGNEYNAKSFINYHDYENLDDMLKRVKEVDENDELYLEMISEPFMSKEKFDSITLDIKKNDEMFLSIFRQPINEAKRKGAGAAIYHYESSLSDMCLNSKKYHVASIMMDKVAWWIPLQKWRDGIRRKMFGMYP